MLQKLFKGGNYSSEKTIQRKKLFKGGNYSREFGNMISILWTHQCSVRIWVVEYSVTYLNFVLLDLFLWNKNACNGGTWCRFGWNKCQLLLIRKIIKGWIWLHQSSLLYLLFPNGPFCGTFSSFLLIFHWNEFVVPKVYVFLLCPLNDTPLPYFLTESRHETQVKPDYFWVAKIYSNWHHIYILAGSKLVVPL